METKQLKDIDDVLTIASVKGLSLDACIKSKKYTDLKESVEMIKKNFNPPFPCQIREMDDKYSISIYCKNKDGEEVALKLTNMKKSESSDDITGKQVDSFIEALAELIY